MCACELQEGAKGLQYQPQVQWHSSNANNNQSIAQRGRGCKPDLGLLGPRILSPEGALHSIAWLRLLLASSTRCVLPIRIAAVVAGQGLQAQGLLHASVKVSPLPSRLTPPQAALFGLGFVHAAV